MYDFMSLKRIMSQASKLSQHKLKEMQIDEPISKISLADDVTQILNYESIERALEDPRNASFSTIFHVQKFLAQGDDFKYFVRPEIKMNRLYVTPNFLESFDVSHEHCD